MSEFIPIGLIEAMKSRGISEDGAVAELKGYWPGCRFRIQKGESFVKIWRNQTLITRQPTLWDAVMRVRWYRAWLAGLG